MTQISEITEAIGESAFPYTVDLVADDELAESYRKQVFSQIQKL